MVIYVGDSNIGGPIEGSLILLIWVHILGGPDSWALPYVLLSEA